MEIQNNDRIKQMVVRYVKGELSEEEMDELKRWRDERAEHEELFRNVVSKEKLGCWYSFDVFYTNKELKEIPYSLNIKKHEDIVLVLKFIE